MKHPRHAFRLYHLAGAILAALALAATQFAHALDLASGGIIYAFVLAGALFAALLLPTFLQSAATSWGVFWERDQAIAGIHMGTSRAKRTRLTVLTKQKRYAGRQAALCTFTSVSLLCLLVFGVVFSLPNARSLTRSVEARNRTEELATKVAEETSKVRGLHQPAGQPAKRS